jgi:hypothetical protein
MNDGMEDMEGNGHGLRYYPRICLEGVRKTIKSLSGYLMSQPTFEPSTSHVQKGSYNNTNLMGREV